MADCPLWTRRRVFSAFLLLPLAAAVVASEDDQLPPAEQLRLRHGLTQINGRVWGLELEKTLLTRLKGLPDLRERIVTTQREIEDAIVRNELAWQQAAPAIEALKRQLAERSISGPQRGLLSEQLQGLKASAVEPAQLPGRDAVRTLLSRLGQDRCALMLELVQIRRTAAELETSYRRLAADAEIARLIKLSGNRSRLGPLRNYAAELRRLADYERLASASHSPIYLQSGRVRLTAVVNDATCVTFTWSQDSDAVAFLPSSAAENAGIEVPADAPREILRIGGRRIEARQVVLESLRLGSCHPRRVAAYVLPPEAEDLGAQLTPLAISPCRARLELAMGRLVIDE